MYDGERRCDLLIQGGVLLDVAAGADPPAVAARSVAIVEDQIAEVGPVEEVARRWRPARTIDASGSVVAPGFVDAHVHLGAFLGATKPYQRPTEPSPFGGSGNTEVALRTVAGFCAMQVPSQLMSALVRPVLASMLRSGFTAVVDAGGPAPEGVWDAAAHVGIRAAIGPSRADRWHDESGVLGTRADTEALLAEAEAFIDAHSGQSPVLVPLASAVDTLGCSDELLTGLAEFAERFDTPMHVHSHIGHDDHRDSVAAYGLGETDRLERSGMLTERATIMHAGVLSDTDIERFATAGVTVNHNPIGNALLGFGVAAERTVPRLIDAGVPVVLGSDWTPAVPTPFDNVRAALMLHRDVAANDLALSLEAALAMSVNGATTLGCHAGMGRLAPGQLADIVLIDTTGSHHLASTHPVPAVALHARPADVHTVIVNGRVVVDDRELVTADERELLAAAREAIDQLAHTDNPQSS